MGGRSVGAILSTASAHLVRGERMRPGYLVVGTKRGGSTSLAEWITAHPDVATSSAGKGTHYFDVNHSRGPGWYAAQFPRTSAGFLLVGESSPYYMFHPLAPGRIAAELPDAKIIMCLRDPVQRAWSHHSYEVSHGRESLDFETAISLETSRLEGEVERIVADQHYSADHWRFHAYLRRGHYAEQLRPYLDLFGAPRVLVVQSEALFARPQEEMDRVHAFLGLPAHRTATRTARNASPSRSEMSESTLARLRAYYEPLNDELYALPGVNFCWTSTAG